VPLTVEPRTRRLGLDEASANVLCAAIRNAGGLRRLQEEQQAEFETRLRLLMAAVRRELVAAAARVSDSERRAAEMTAYAEDVEWRASKAEQWLDRVRAEHKSRPRALRR
jgi:hypothetical protein